MPTEKGQISVNTENIFPIIRKWLYSDRDIFLRELVSNAADANSKLRRVAGLGEFDLGEDEELFIKVEYDSDKSTLVVEDNGIGMTAEEVKKYINQIAFSGVMDFMDKYKDQSDENAGIIGHFGLGFYSAFMVAENVRIDTLSYQDGAAAASWQSDDGMGYEMGDSDKKTRGTTITLTLSEDGKNFITGDQLRDVLQKYCGFMAYPIYYTDVAAEKKLAEDRKKRAEEAAKEAEKEAKEKGEDEKEAAEKAKEEALRPPKIGPINDTQPLWLKAPRDCTDEEYKAFYKKAFGDYRDPLFWIHLNLDYPFRLQGILYFPKTDNVYESLEGRIKIYYNQVFVADNIKEIIPEFLFLLKGTLDCPDLPLNVSRSFLQNDAYVNKLSSHIVRKVADKLSSLSKNERESYEKYWQDIGVFVKYGMMRDDKFHDKVKDICLLKTVDGEYKTAADFKDTILYTPDPDQQVAYVRMAKERGLDVVVMDHEIDNHFMSFFEQKENGKRFKRVDAELGGKEIDSDRKDAIEKLFRAASGKEKLDVKVQALGEQALPAMIVESEESRRMQEMRKQFEQFSSPGDDGPDIDSMFPLQQTLVINEDQPLVSRLLAMAELPGKEAQANSLARQVYDLARLGHGSLTADDMAEFLKRSSDLLAQLTESGEPQEG